MTVGFSLLAALQFLKFINSLGLFKTQKFFFYFFFFFRITGFAQAIQKTVNMQPQTPGAKRYLERYAFVCVHVHPSPYVCVCLCLLCLTKTSS